MRSRGSGIQGTGHHVRGVPAGIGKDPKTESVYPAFSFIQAAFHIVPNTLLLLLKITRFFPAAC